MGFVKRVIQLGLKSVSELRAANAAASPKSYCFFSSNSSTTNRLKDELISPPLHDQPAVRNSEVLTSAMTEVPDENSKHILQNVVTNSPSVHLYNGRIFANGKRVFCVDRLALNLEAHGIPPKHAQALASVMTQVLDDSLKTISHNFVPNAKIKNMLNAYEARLLKIRSEILCSKVQGRHLPSYLSNLQFETENMRYDINNVACAKEDWIRKKCLIHNILRIDRVIARSTDFINKLDRDIHELKEYEKALKESRKAPKLNGLPMYFSCTLFGCSILVMCWVTFCL